MLNGSWNDVTLASPTSTKARQAVNTGTTNQFRVQATDLAGNTGAWKNGPSFGAVVTQDTSAKIVYSGAWRSVSRTDALGGTLRSATAVGAFAKLTFTGRGVAWVAPRTSPGATIAVYVDGRFIKNVYLSSNSYQARRVVFSMSWKARATHTIKIIKKYRSYTLPIDALLVLN
jgi:hypothetical protein